jgi:hypothetical protein
MTGRNTLRNVSAALVATALVLAAASDANATRVNRSPTAGTSTTGQSAPSWGYGRGWCYWHPYSCRYR